MLEKIVSRGPPSLVSAAQAICQENETLQGRARTLELENRRLRAELDWVREKLLEVEAMLWSGRPVAGAYAADGRGLHGPGG